MQPRTETEQEQYDYFMKLMTKYLKKIHDQEKEIDMLRTRLIDLGVESSGEMWDA